MTVMAPVSALALDALTRLSAGLPLPETAAAPEKQPKLPDVVVFSSPPLRILSDLASAGLRQLATLLPMIEQAVQEQSTAPLGHLAKAASAAARQIGDGHDALLAEGPDRVAASMQRPVVIQSRPAVSAISDAKQLLRTLARQIGAEIEPAEDGRASEPLRTIARQIGAADRLEPRSSANPDVGPIQRWIAEAKHLLRSTGDALERAEERLRPLAAADPTTLASGTQATSVLTEVLAAQAQIALAYTSVSQTRTTARVNYRIATPSTLSLDRLAGATTIFGISLILATLWTIGGLWSAAAGIAALGGAAVWVWRINRASRGVTLDAPG